MAIRSSVLENLKQTRKSKVLTWFIILQETASEDTISAPASPTTCSSRSSICCSVKSNADPKQILNVSLDSS